MNKRELSLIIVIVCIAILHVTTAMVHVNNLRSQITILKTQNEKLFNDICEIDKAYQKEIDRLTGEPLGDFVTTFYCPTGNRTSTGTIPKEGRTVAIDPKVVAPGSTVRIEYNGRSKIFKVEDSGVRGRVVDTFIESEEQAVKLGVKKVKVYLVEETK